MSVRIRLRRDTTANWELNNPVLALGEIGLDITNGNFKIGNGTDQWTGLDYFSTAVEDVISQGQLDNAISSIGGTGITWDGTVYNLDDPFNSNGSFPNLRAQSTTAEDVGLGNVTNESKETMFTDPTFTGTVSGVTKNHVGLGNVENFEISTEIEAKNGEVNNKYMTPLLTKEAILALSPPTDLTPVESRLTIIEGDDQTEGSIEKALADAKLHADSEIIAASLALGTNYSVADIEERDNLENLVVGDIVFVEDNGDEKWAQYKVTVSDPLSFLKIMDQDILINALDAEGIKSAYESNTNTNAFTDAEKSKLSNLQIGTTVQPFSIDTVVDPDYATFNPNGEYENLRAKATTKEDIGLSNVLDIEQATKTEFNTHTQDSTIHFTQASISITESQISDFQNYELADETILKDANIGVTVQAFDANTVIDAAYNNFNPSATYANLRAQATTKTDIGLSNIENYSIATKEEAETGTEEEKYMNPLRTAEAIAFQTNAILTSGSYATETYVDNQIAGIGGDGLVFDSNSIEYNLDYATQEEVEAGTSTTKVLTPASIQFMIIDGGEFN